MFKWNIIFICESLQINLVAIFNLYPIKSWHLVDYKNVNTIL